MKLPIGLILDVLDSIVDRFQGEENKAKLAQAREELKEAEKQLEMQLASKAAEVKEKVETPATKKKH